MLIATLLGAVCGEGVAKVRYELASLEKRLRERTRGDQDIRLCYTSRIIVINVLQLVTQHNNISASTPFSPHLLQEP
jgi:hypothetical protein